MSACSSLLVLGGECGSSTPPTCFGFWEEKQEPSRREVSPAVVGRSRRLVIGFASRRRVGCSSTEPFWYIDPLRAGMQQANLLLPGATVHPWANKTSSSSQGPPRHCGWTTLGSTREAAAWSTGKKWV